jgi:hypothetical protein
MSELTNLGDEPRNYSPFWPVFAVFLTFTVVQAYGLRSFWQQRKQIEATHVEVKKNLGQAQALLQLAESVARDLVVLARANSAEATKIANEFHIPLNINVNQPAAQNPPKPAPAK